MLLSQYATERSALAGSALRKVNVDTALTARRRKWRRGSRPLKRLRVKQLEWNRAMHLDALLRAEGHFLFLEIIERIYLLC